VAVRHSGRDDGAVVLVFARPEQQLLARALFGARDEDLVIQLGLAGPEHDEWQLGRFEHAAQVARAAAAGHAIRRPRRW
jgi:hypothetical protein